MTVYGLDGSIARKRALAGAAAGTIATVGPVIFGIILLLRTGTPLDKTIVIAVCGAIGVLAIIRLTVAYGRMKADLSRLKIEVTPEALEVETRRKKHRVPKDAVESITEIPGWLGGLRINLVEGWDGTRSSPEYLDVPRGGDGFGELRSALETWKPVDLPKKRGRIARVAIGVAIVLGLFFVPFVVADLGQFPMMAAAMVLVGIVAMRIALSRR